MASLHAKKAKKVTDEVARYWMRELGALRYPIEWTILFKMQQ